MPAHPLEVKLWSSSEAYYCASQRSLSLSPPCSAERDSSLRTLSLSLSLGGEGAFLSGGAPSFFYSGGAGAAAAAGVEEGGGDG